MSLQASSSSQRPSTPSAVDSQDRRSASTEVESGFGKRAAEKRELLKQAEAYGALKAKQNAWKAASKTVKDLESVKGRSADEEKRLDDAKRYLLLNEKPAGAGRKTRRGGKKHAKKGRKGGKSRRH